jgi:hypothetical protein
MTGIYFGNTRITLCIFANFRYPLTFDMARKVIDLNVEREVALQAMQRLQSCYSNALLILKSNKVRASIYRLTIGLDSPGTLSS